ncbi:hypothetical protein Salat_2131200 [Sesamum alatum]|uniref:Uncharacterized protein n=1 Tax=Sesamum alatum TaxID=300844 RepID=A0AAE2CGW6_9LAMI|nr:hypothetical protein Salat_2131200 [Sesamum alatum]
MKGAADELSSRFLRSIIHVTENTLWHVSGHAPHQSNRHPPIYTLVPRVSSTDIPRAGSRPSTAAVLKTHADGSPPFEPTPRGDHFEPSPTHFGQRSSDRLPLLARELLITVVTPPSSRPTPSPPSSTPAPPSSKLTNA